MVVLGFFVVPRPQFPTYDDAARLCGNCSRVAVTLKLERLQIQYEGATFLERSVAQAGVGFLVALPLALALYLDRSDRFRAGGRAARWARGTMAAGLSVFALVGESDILYANTGNHHTFAYAIILWMEERVGSQSFGEAGALALAVAAAGAVGYAGLRRGILRYVAPAAFVFSVGLSLLDFKEISIHATDFLAGLTLNHTDVVSNWSLLSALGLLTLFGALDARRDKPGRAAKAL
jgi:hypothetical protein